MSTEEIPLRISVLYQRLLSLCLSNAIPTQVMLFLSISGLASILIVVLHAYLSVVYVSRQITNSDDYRKIMNYCVQPTWALCMS